MAGEEVIDNIVKLLHRKNIKEIISGNEYRFYLCVWNIIPYGFPSECKPNLLVIIDGTVKLSEIFERALEQLEKCMPTCGRVLIYVQVDEEIWKESWFSYADQFEELEAEGVNIKIHFV